MTPFTANGILSGQMKTLKKSTKLTILLLMAFVHRYLKAKQKGNFKFIFRGWQGRRIASVTETKGKSAKTKRLNTKTIKFCVEHGIYINPTMWLVFVTWCMSKTCFS